MLVIKTVPVVVCLFAGLVFSGTLLPDWRTRHYTSTVTQPNHTLLDVPVTSLVDSTGATIYKTNCGICHNGAVAEAPRFESLQRLPSHTIIEALRNGIMKQQGAALTNEQQRLVAEYISTVGDDKASAMAGRCVQGETIPGAKPQVSNWRMGLENRRYIDARHVQINTTNAAQLTLDWVFAFPDATRARSQPTIAGNTLFTASQQGVICALDRAGGCIRWTFQADTEVRSSLVIGTDKSGNADRL